MREIKFRAWYNNKMEYNICLNMYGNYWHYDGIGFIGYSEVPVMQFTGFRDKNNKDIYEGDIIKFLSGDKRWIISKIEWLCGRYVVTSDFGVLESLGEQNFLHLEIIGNIIENPGKLKTLVSS